MISILAKIIAVAVLVQFAFSAYIQDVDCPEGVQINELFRYQGQCSECNCTGTLDFTVNPETGLPNMHILMKGPCKTCGSQMHNCTETEIVNPDVDYPACCEERCVTNSG
ncbi:Hypothetical predicted protein [Octopus vulgaris]|uniref:von Willebrand factor C domain-containing protein 2-like n=1 Tax=Octopus vulgaris TaxID=6645 RepID=A0AA36FFL8_OCTVU|nr:Hypothetical predicted protein [Octopus vulgaris]